MEGLVLEIQKKIVGASGIRFFVVEGGKEIARAFLFLMKNDLHPIPFGLMEDVFVEKAHRGKGIGTKIVEELVRAAKKENCYKLICTSRHSNKKVHELYKKIGFKEQGLEFRMDF